MNDEPKPAPLHPVDVAIITDWLMPDDDEPMTWDERDGRYPAAVVEDEPDDDETDMTWDRYRSVMVDSPKNFSEVDMPWLQSHSPTPVLMALDLDLLIADEECMEAAADKLIELDQFLGYPKNMVKTLFDMGYRWEADEYGDTWVKS